VLQDAEMLGVGRSIAASLALGAASIHSADEVEREINAIAQQPNAGLIVLPNPVTNVLRELIITSCRATSVTRCLCLPVFCHGRWLDLVRN
jgi:hypothetical protein